MSAFTKLLSRPAGWLLRANERARPSGAARNRRGSPRRRHGLNLEPLEDRCVPSAPAVLDPNLGVRTVVQLGPAGAAINPTNLVFLGDNDFLLTEKSTGKVDHIVNGVNEATRFDFGAGPIPNLPVNFNSERGLLGITLSPNFASDHLVYLYWTENNSGPAPDSNVADVPLLGNRVDRFVWNAATSTLTFDRNIIRLHAFQNDGNGGNPGQMAGNHNGGVIHFGPDGKLYIVIGDNGRRGWMQNLVNGPNGFGQTDENNGPVRGGPAPDDAHLTGVLLRLNPDGSVPDDNPFSDILTTLQAPVLSDSEGTALGSFTAFLNQEMTALTVNATFQGLAAPTVAGQIRLDGADGPVIFTVPAFPTGETSGEVTTTLTAANFVAEPLQGINTLQDAFNAVLNGRAHFTIYTTQSQQAGGEASGTVAQLDPEITANLHRVFAYGIRNSFGFDFDPVTGLLWLEENGDISFDKISVVTPGSDNGWIQSSAPLLNVDGTFDDVALQEFRSIELTAGAPQQTRWPSANIATTAQEAYNRLLLLPGAHYNPPVYSVRAEDPPAGLAFYTSSVLGVQYQNLLFEGEARDFLTSPLEQFDGALFVYHPNGSRTGLDFGGDPNIRTSDNVFTNSVDFDLMGDTSFLFGTGFGIATGIVTGPDGNLYVVSETKNAVFEIYNKGATASFQQTNLVADTATPQDSTGQALAAPEAVDPNLKNPWGIAFSATSPFWISNQRTNTSTLYAGDRTQPDGSISPITVNSLVVAVPGGPTGQVRNNSTGFRLANGNPASFIFDTVNGTIAGWNTGNNAEIKATVSGAVYTGLAIGGTSAGTFLYAANVSQGRIDVFDSTFAQVPSGPSSFVFSDPNLPNPGLSPYTPFNIQNLNGVLYVAYRNRTDVEHGGIVDAYDTNGNFLRRVVSDGVNAPWGLALAPAGFGNFGGALLVGNFGLGDGRINAYDPNTGRFLGNLTDASGNPIAIEGLWAIAFGNGGSGGDANALYFTAGINRTGSGSFGAADGLFGSLRFEGFGGGAADLPGRAVGVSLDAPNSLTSYGQRATFTAQVTPADPSAATPTGTVVFLDGDTVLGSADLDASGRAVFSTSGLRPGPHSITAFFQGDANFDPALSLALTQTVTKAATAVTLTSSTAQTSEGDTVTITVNVAALAPGGAIPTGTVTLKDGHTVLGTAQIDDNGQAVFVLDALLAGTHRLKVRFHGSDLFSGSVSDVLEEVVTP